MEKKTEIELKNNIIYINGVDILEENERLMKENIFLKKENQNYIDILNTLNSIARAYDSVNLKINNIEIQELVRKVNNNEKYHRKSQRNNK